MISESIEKETKVWHSDYGPGIFYGWVQGLVGVSAVIRFYSYKFLIAIPAKDLTEVE